MEPSIFPAASLKAAGEVVANDSSCAIVCEVIAAATGWDGTLFDRRREIVGKKTPSNLGP